MKNLRDYIIEQSEKDTNPDINTTVKLNLTGIEGAEDFIKELNEKANESSISLNIDNEQVTFTLNPEIITNAMDVITFIKTFVETLGKSTKRASDESYAQKIAACEAEVKKIDDFIEQANQTLKEQEPAKTDDKAEPKSDNEDPNQNKDQK